LQVLNQIKSSLSSVIILTQTIGLKKFLLSRLTTILSMAGRYKVMNKDGIQVVYAEADKLTN